MNRRNTYGYEFDSFYLDPEERLLVRAGKPVPLTPKVLDTLVVLVENGGHLVLKDELMKALWPDSFVEEISLARNISELRKALGETVQDQRYIVTVPGRGYRFVAPVREIDPGTEGAKLLIRRNSWSRVVIEEEEEQTGARALPAATAKVLQLVELRIAKHWKVAISLGAVAIAVGAFFYSHRGKPLGEKDTIVLGDFDNKTGDHVFDDTLKQALAVQLEQSPVLNLLPDERVAQTLSSMAQPKDTRLTHELAWEVCQRTASAAVLDGSIALVGTRYLLTVKALNCSNGESLASTEAQARDKNSVLGALGKLATEIRGKLGESLASVRKYDVPLEDVTTPSLEALKAYSLGVKSWLEKGLETSPPFFQRAVELDPHFAMAYARRGTAYNFLGDQRLMTENLRRAYELREKLSERERLYIESHYYHYVLGDLEQAAQVYELWKQIYPRDVTPYDNLVGVYSDLGRYEKALEEARETLRLQPDAVLGYEDLGRTYLLLNRLGEAETVLKQAEEHRLESDNLVADRYYLAFRKGHAGDMERLVAAARGKPGTEGLLLFLHGLAKAYYGQLSQARGLFQQSAESAERNRNQESSASVQVSLGLIEAHVGYSRQARRDCDSGLRRAMNRVIALEAALTLALTGDIRRAENLAAELSENFPLDPAVQYVGLPTIRAAIALEQNFPAQTIEMLRPITPYEFGLMSNREGPYLRGQAYLMLHNGPAAAAEFQKIIDHAGIIRFRVFGALAHIGLARAYALQGDTAKARTGYQEFFTLWKDADPDIPVLKEAKAEYAKLQ